MSPKRGLPEPAPSLVTVKRASRHIAGRPESARCKCPTSALLPALPRYTWSVLANTSQPTENLGMRKLCALALLGLVLPPRAPAGFMGRCFLRHRAKQKRT